MMKLDPTPIIVLLAIIGILYLFGGLIDYILENIIKPK